MQRSSNISRRRTWIPATRLLMPSWRLLTSGSMQFGEAPKLLTWLTELARLALSLDPGLADGHLALASVFEQTGNEQGALDEIAKALSLDPSNPRTLVWQAQIYTRLNRWEDAEKTFHRALKEHPNYWLAYNELGFGLHGQARYQEAIQAFRAASLAAPKNSMASSNLGGEYLQIGEFAEALGDFEAEPGPGS